MTARIIVALTLSVRSPFLFPGLANSTLGVDLAPLRDEQRRPILPASQLQGVLRERLNELAEAGILITPDEVRELFGAVSPAAEQTVNFDVPLRGCTIPGDLIAQDVPAAECETSRIAIDDIAGAVRTGYLQVVELVAPPGQAVTFRGRAILYWQEADAPRIVNAWQCALRMLPAIGGFKTAGFGEVLPEACSARIVSDTAARPPAALRDGPTRFGLAVTFDRPILVDARRVAENAFAGAATVPGGVFKGALARKLGLLNGEAATQDRFGATLREMVFSHAWPEDSAGEPGGMALPLSLVSVKAADGPVFGDALNLERTRGGELLGPMIACQPAVFQPDWKDAVHQAARTHFGIKAFEPPDELPRTHTAIADTVAEDQSLFTAIGRSAVWRDKPDKARRWLMSVDIAGVADQAQARELLGVLMPGLDGIGRTGATASFDTWDAGAAYPAVAPVLDTGETLFAVVLLTDAVLTDPRTPMTAEQAYAAYWKA
jgi:hypothetical protein